jgi:NAD(P)-dependent dehydrogenase (short-subunit alcohol dehydrogenase family)
VITGAADGLGRALAVELARRSAHLILSDIDVAGAEDTAGIAMAEGATSARVVRCDVTRLEEIEALNAACAGDIDLVANNAGVASAGKVGELPVQDWRWTVEIDLWGVIYGCHVFVPRLRRQGHGHILNVASAAGLLCAPGMGAYNVAKAGVVALSETLAAELLGTGIGVTVLCPTFFQSSIAKSGRFAEPRVRARAQRLVERGKAAESVARAALRCVDRGRLYALPMADARWLWRLKRLSPQIFRVVMAQVRTRF